MKIWHLPEQERLTAESIDLLRHTSVLPAQEKRVETVAWSPVARDVLATSVYTAVEVIDVEAGEKKIGMNNRIETNIQMDLIILVLFIYFFLICLQTTCVLYLKLNLTLALEAIRS